MTTYTYTGVISGSGSTSGPLFSVFVDVDDPSTAMITINADESYSGPVNDTVTVNDAIRPSGGGPGASASATVNASSQLSGNVNTPLTQTNSSDGGSLTLTYTFSGDLTQISVKGNETLNIGGLSVDVPLLGVLTNTSPVSSPLPVSPSTVPTSPAPTTPTSPGSGIQLMDTSTGASVPVTPAPYSGPVAGLQSQYVYTGTDNVNITVATDNWFLKGGPGEDALQAFGGYNVVDGSTGSNFLTGGSSTDTFFVDDRSPPSDIWSTVNNFHQGDDATVFGIVQSPAIQWFDNQGAPGFTGLTLHIFGQNAPTASLTLVGYSSADLNNGRLTVQFGNEADGTPFMHIIGTG